MKQVMIIIGVLLLVGCSGVSNIAKPNAPVLIAGKPVQLQVGDWVKTKDGFMYEVEERQALSATEELFFTHNFVEVRPAAQRR